MRGPTVSLRRRIAALEALRPVPGRFTWPRVVVPGGPLAPTFDPDPDRANRIAIPDTDDRPEPTGPPPLERTAPL